MSKPIQGSHEQVISRAGLSHPPQGCDMKDPRHYTLCISLRPSAAEEAARSAKKLWKSSFRYQSNYLAQLRLVLKSNVRSCGSHSEFVRESVTKEPGPGSFFLAKTLCMTHLISKVILAAVPPYPPSITSCDTQGHIPTAHSILYLDREDAMQMFAENYRVKLTYPQAVVIGKFSSGLHAQPHLQSSPYDSGSDHQLRASRTSALPVLHSRS